jgi:hypothetical protein
LYLKENNKCCKVAFIVFVAEFGGFLYMPFITNLVLIWVFLTY